jgi:hypothetical protein
MRRYRGSWLRLMRRRSDKVDGREGEAQPGVAEGAGEDG